MIPFPNIKITYKLKKKKINCIVIGGMVERGKKLKAGIYFLIQKARIHYVSGGADNLLLCSNCC